MSDLEIISFLNRLEKADVRISLEGEHLGVVFPGEQDDLLLYEIREHKSSLLQFLRNAATPISGVQPPPSAQRITYPLAYTQKRIWLHEKLEPHNRAYYIYSDVMIRGPLDTLLLEAALDAMLQKHEVLRTIFDMENGQPVQRILPHSDFDVELPCILFHQPFTKYAQEKIGEYRRSVQLDLETGPLFRLQLFRFPDNAHILSFCIHHIIADAQSLAVFMSDIIGMYRQLSDGNHSLLTGGGRQFSDYCEWEEAQRQLPSFAADRAYWMRQFATQPVPIVLPYIAERKHQKTYKGRAIDMKLSPATAERMQRYCREQEVTPFTLCYATVQALLFRYTEQNDLTIGTSVHGRDDHAFGGQVGLYARTLPLRTSFTDDTGFTELLRLSKATVQDALAHQQYPFDMLTEETGFLRDPSRSPFFDIMIDYFSAQPLPQVSGMEFSAVKFPHTTSKFDMTFTFTGEADGMQLRIEYNTDLFDEAFMEQFSGHYRQLLDCLLDNPTKPISRLPFLDGEQVNQLLSCGCGKDEMQAFEPIKNLFEATAARWPRREAVACDGCVISYAELNTQANRLAHYLAGSLGSTNNKIVGIMLDRSEQLIIAVMAVLKCGAAFLPVDPAAPVDYRRHILSDSGAALLITGTHWLADLSGLYDGEIFAIDVQLDVLEGPANEPVSSIKDTDLAYILYTSGSTGAPKGVQVTQQNISNYLRWATAHYYHDMAPASVPWFTSFSFDLSLTSIFTPLLRGDRLVIYPHPDPRAAFMEMLNAAGSFGMMKLTPSHINVLGMMNASALKVERVIVGGEELTPAHIDILRKASPGIRVFNEYGPTETTVGCTVEEVSEHGITIGFPMSNATIYILNRSGELMPPGCWGEITVGGAGVARGYHRLPELTAKKFLADRFMGGGARMYRTGDIGRWLPNGKLAYKGRADNQVKINGFRIELGEIENKLQQLEGVEKATVLVKEEKGLKSLLAFFSGNRELDGMLLRDRLSSLVPVYMLPTQYVRVEQWPLTVNGKTDKAALLQLSQQASGRPANIRMPQTEKEKELAALFEELLSVQGIGADENLFTLGLDSLRVIRAQMLIEEKYPGRIQVHDLFSQSSVAKLAAHIHGVPVPSQQLPDLIDF